MKIIFIRHGEPDYENDTLTEKGFVQAELVSQRLLEEGISEIYASPLGRAQDTARPLSEKTGLPVKTLGFMRELTWGSIDGGPVFSDGHPWDISDEMAKQGMDLTRTDWETNEFYRNNKAVSSVRTVEEGLDKWLAGFGYRRNGLYYEHDNSEDEHKIVALFSHGGSSTAAIAHMLNLPFPYAIAMLHIDFTGITVLRLDKKKGAGVLPCMKLANDTKHLK